MNAILFQPTGEVRPPKKGEWFLNRDDTPCLCSQFFETYCTSHNIFPIFTRHEIPAEVAQRMMEEGK